jgi:hypothetical protein
MGKKEIYLFIAAAALEIIAVGLGMTGTISPSWGWFIAGCGFILFGFALFRVFRNRLKSEVSKRVKDRKQYLPQLKEALKEYIAWVEQMAQTDNQLYDLARYKEVYIRKRTIGNDAIWGKLWRQKVCVDNLIYRQIKDTDKTTRDILQRFDTCLTDVKDKKLRKYLRGERGDKGIIEASHVAYSYGIFCRLTNKMFKNPPKQASSLFEVERKMIKSLRELHNMINQRIDELLEGAEDEE